MKFTKIPADTFKQIQLNAGILVESFDPATQTIDGIIAATCSQTDKESIRRLQQQKNEMEP